MALLGIALAVALLVLSVRAVLERQKDIFETVQAPPIPYGEMREGDLAFRTGRGMYSELLDMRKSPADTLLYSHIGLVVGPLEDGRWYVVHAVPSEPDFRGDFNRVKMETVEDFFAGKRASGGELVHVNGVEFPKELAAEAMQFARDSIRFDEDYSLADENRLYCTELVWRQYMKAGVDLSEGRRTSYAPVVKQPVIEPMDIRRYKGTERYFYYKD